ncbi:Rhodanese-related sulfurtransferase [Hymenobacter daecheongensis DSM 21074]|uniref:Rhodanese-related sulfurtransferase n=1 Tax=Hymenobacter daecheongensis DSM 21074 TaxID=1121955 RepID=A0A1M6D0T8_9BACT|nr:rhodanese-like domain-containing protein [Hymenobacter daecheongensis]SHI66877.1 Rhodanese-related sulfurtransferase [Hymenobacter daecheongensis DSM 21074]
MLPDLTPEDLHARLQRGETLQLIDVREPEEYEYCRIEGSQLISLGDIPGRADELPTDRPVVLICHHGVRSGQALAYLQHRHGLTNLLNLRGGIHAWSVRVDPTVAVY